MAKPTKKRAFKQPQGKQRVGLAARRIAAKLLGQILDEGKSLDMLVDKTGGDAIFNTLIAKDRALIRAILIVALRRKGQIDAALNRVIDRKTPKRATHLTHTLSVAAAQILFLDVPDSAAVNLAVTAITEDRLTSRFASLTNAVLRRLAREKNDILEAQDATRLNTPDWFFKQMRKSYGKDRAYEIAAMHHVEPAVDITVKDNPQYWADRLGGVALLSSTVRLETRKAVPLLEGYDAGEWWVQDAAASLPTQLLGDVRGKKIADLCAAPGGKTAQMINFGADVTSLEVSHSRAKRLFDNLARLKYDAKIIETDILTWLPETQFDAVLLDAPCSSTGTIRRHPDIMWTKTPADIAALAELQFQFWNRAIDLVKPGGVVVFANCSLLRAEGEDLYAKMLASRDDIEPVPVMPNELPGLENAITGQGTMRTLPIHLPHEQSRMAGMDGFFAARLRRK